MSDYGVSDNTAFRFNIQSYNFSKTDLGNFAKTFLYTFDKYASVKIHISSMIHLQNAHLS